MAKANVTIIEAPMGEGKTNTVTGILIDDYFANLKAIISPNTGNIFPVQPVKGEIVKMFNPSNMEQEHHSGPFIFGLFSRSVPGKLLNVSRETFTAFKFGKLSKIISTKLGATYSPLVISNTHRFCSVPSFSNKAVVSLSPILLIPSATRFCKQHTFCIISDVISSL